MKSYDQKMMRTGRMRQTIVWKRDTVTGQNTFGGDTVTPTTVLTCMADVWELSGNELAAAQQRWAEVQYKIGMRRQPGATLAMTDYIEWQGRRLDVLHIEGMHSTSMYWIVLAKDHVE